MLLSGITRRESHKRVSNHPETNLATRFLRAPTLNRPATRCWVPSSSPSGMMHSSGGKNREATASDDPISVIHTMLETADENCLYKAGKFGINAHTKKDGGEYSLKRQKRYRGCVDRYHSP